jgi:ribose transport system substrate-binding protein
VSTGIVRGMMGVGSIAVIVSAAALGASAKPSAVEAGIKLSPTNSAYSTYQALSLDKKLHTTLPCTSSPAPAKATAYTVPKAKKKYTIAMMEPTLAGHYYQASAGGAKLAAKQAGVKLDLVSAGTGYASPEQQIAQADQELSKKVDAVVVIPTDIQGGVALIQKFVDKGIPVINVGTEAATDKAYMIMQDDYLMGKLSADELVKKLGKNAGPGIIIGGPANATWSRKRVAGFEDQVKAKYPGVKVAAAPTQNVDPALGLSSFQNAVAKNPNIKWVYTVFNLLLSPKSMPSQYKHIGFITNGLDGASAPDLKAGRVSEVIGITPTPMGYQGVGEAVAVLNGDQNVPALTCIPITTYSAQQVPSAQASRLELIPGEKV